MAASVDVRSIDEMKALRLALRRFMERARPAVDEVDTQIHRLRDWLEGEQMRHWRLQLRKRESILADARGHLRAMQATGAHGACATERRQVSAAEHQMEEAQQKLSAIRGWLTRLDTETRDPLTRCRQLSAVLDSDLPAGDRHLKQLIEGLEAYASPQTNRTHKPAAKQMSQHPMPADEPEIPDLENDQ